MSEPSNGWTWQWIGTTTVAAVLALAALWASATRWWRSMKSTDPSLRRQIRQAWADLSDVQAQKMAADKRIEELLRDQRDDKQELVRRQWRIEQLEALIARDKKENPS